jgi:hypothetical protein
MMSLGEERRKLPSRSLSRRTRVPQIRRPMMKNTGWQLWAAPVAALVMSVAGTGCASDPETATASAHVQIAVPLAFQGVISRMTVQVDGSVETDLDSSAGQFTGLVVVPAGARTFVGRAYDASGAKVGESQPLQATITAGVVQGVQLMILDTSSQAPSTFGPAIVSLTYPETGEVNQPFALAIQAVDPDGDAVAIQWTTSCADATFGDATAATTTWTRAVTGGCTISVSASSNGLAVARTFSVVTFPAGSQQGAVKVTGQFVPGPSQPQLNIGGFPNGAGCSIYAGVTDSTCQTPVQAGATLNWNAYAYDAATINLTDNCGGVFSVYYDYGYQKYGYWVAPAGKTSCIITATSTNSSGASNRSQAGIVIAQ